jgi:hypothetical protein
MIVLYAEEVRVILQFGAQIGAQLLPVSFTHWVKCSVWFGSSRLW